MRVGIGYDVHAFDNDRKLILGGVDIEHNQGLAGHSDADVLVHSIMDALLGSVNMGDIGIHFPDTDIKYKNISSLKLLSAVKEKLTAAGYRIVNIDSVLIMEEPKIFPYVPQMKKNIAGVLEIDENQINIKATTTERLGFCGRREGVASEAVVLVE